MLDLNLGRDLVVLVHPRGLEFHARLVKSGVRARTNPFPAEEPRGNFDPTLSAARLWLA